MRVRRRSTALVLPVALAILVGCTASDTTQGRRTTSASHTPRSHRSPKPAPSPKPTHHASGSPQPSGACPVSPLRGVYHPYRLHVLGTCRKVVGRVSSVRHEEDGDYHVNVLPDPPYRRLLDAANRSEQGGALVTEIMPGQRLPVPSVGERVVVFGTWVLDTSHGWNEIHPIWSITYLDRGTKVFAFPPATPAFDPDAAEGGTTSPVSGCDPNYTGACLHDGIGDYDCGGGSGDAPNFTAPGVVIRVVGADPFGLDGNDDGRACG